MKVSKLIEELGREIDGKKFTREELLERVLEVSEELRELDHEREVVSAVVARYAPGAAEDGSASEDGRQQQSDVDERPQKGLQVRWPAGPHYQKQFKVKARQAWPYYKLGTADWYLSTLREIDANVKKLDRLVGVEMAIDGAVQALGATFDAAVYALISSLEGGANLPNEQRIPEQLANWTALIDQAEAFGVNLRSAPDVFIALAEDDPNSPTGWLAQLLLLRQRCSRHDPLIRHWVVGSEAPIICIDVPGGEPRPPIEYLSGVRDLVEQLLELMLEDLELIRRGRVYTAGEEDDSDDAEHNSSSPDGELPDLLRRAGITTPYY